LGGARPKKKKKKKKKVLNKKNTSSEHFFNQTNYFLYKSELFCVYLIILDFQLCLHE
jgi:hypothetical protein